MAITTVGRQFVRGSLPDKYKKYADSAITKKSLGQLATAIAKQDPEGYLDILQNLNRIGQRVVSVYGRDTAITLDDIDTGAQVRNTSKKLRQLINAVVNDQHLTQKQKQQKIVQLGYKYTSKLQQTALQDARKRKTGIANQIASGSRGNPTQLMQLVVGDMLMKDPQNKDIPYLAMAAYADGDSPMSNWVSAMSGRKSQYDVQAATGRVGYLGKQASNITHNVPIAEYDCGTDNTGIPVPAASTDNVGALLLQPWKGHPAGSVVTQKMISQAEPDDQMVIRSPITCKSHSGVCALCSGIQQNGKFPAIGSYVALNASKTFIQPLTQAGISCLHPGTPVRMADWSIKAIKDVNVGDCVIGVSVTGQTRPVKVVNKFDNGIQPVYLFKYRNGFKTKHMLSVACTQEHKLLQVTRKSSCKQQVLNNVPRVLEAGTMCRHISTVKPQAAKQRLGKSQPHALILGLMLGDGCYTKGVKYQTMFSCADPSLIQQLEDYMKSIDLKFKLCAGHDIYYRVSKLSAGNQTNSLKRKLIQYDMLGKYAQQKQLPKDVFQWDSKSVSQLISGLLITDGCIYTQKVTGKRFIAFASTSARMVMQIKNLLQMHCNAFCQTPSRHIKRKNALYTIVYNKASEARKVAKFLKLYGVKQPRRLQLIQATQNIEGHQKLFTCKRQSIKFLGNMPTIDIQVDHPDHLFLLGNGLVCSNSKHGSGMGGKKVQNPDGQDQPVGFDSVQRMLAAPKIFPGGAVLAPADGKVADVRQAPQGGWFVTVAQNTVYVPSIRKVKVKPGDTVQAGDMLTNGVPNPMQIVKYKGIGQGRRYFTKKLNQILPAAGAGTMRRNLQQFSRAMINKVRITADDGYAGYLPGDIADYDQIVSNYKPREDSKQVPVQNAVNTYLQSPVLYYSVGTRVTPSIAKNLQKYNIKKVVTNTNPPPFQAEFIRSKQILGSDKHWLPRLAGQNLTKNLFAAARRGMTDQYNSPSFVDKIVIDPFKPNTQTK